MSREEYVIEIVGFLAYSNKPKAWLAMPIMIIEINKLHLGIDS